MTALAKNPLFLDTLIIDEVIAFYRDAIKRHRAQLLALVSPLSHLCVSGTGLLPIRTTYRLEVYCVGIHPRVTDTKT